MKKKIISNYYVIFSMLFVLTITIVLAPFWINGRSIVWSGFTGDGLMQHYNALMYLGKWGREVIKTLIQEHTLEIPLWDFSIGYGTDIIAGLHYYAFGDPLNLLSIFVPSKYTEYLYMFLSVLRIYLSGIAFSKYCFYMKREKIAILFGSFIYMFSGYTLFSFARHPFFLTPMIYFPLLLLEAERVMKKEKNYMFIAIVGLMTLCNFYFSYMMLILLVIYVTVRFFSVKYDSWKHLLKKGLCLAGKFLLFILIGLSISCIVFIPVILFLFSGDRLSGNYSIELLYGLEQYEAIIAGFLRSQAGDYYTVIGIAPIAVVALLVMLMSPKKHRELKVGVCILSIMLCVPVFGHIMNGMSYVSNRWIFSYAFILSYIFVVMWKDLLHITRKQKVGFFLFAIIYFLLLLNLPRVADKNTMASFIVMLFSFILLCYHEEGKEQRKKVIVTGTMVLLLCSIGINVKYRFGLYDNGTIRQYSKVGNSLKEIYNTGALALREVCGDIKKIERLDDPVGVKNSSWQNRTFGINYYCSIENGAISQFFDEMGTSDHLAQFYQGLDSRTMLNELVSVKYFTETNEANAQPFGYEWIGEANGYKVAENRYALPLGYTYDSYLTREEYKKMTPIQRQQALMQGILLEDEIEGYNHIEPTYSDKNKEYKIKCSSGVDYKEGKYIVIKDNAKITLEFEGDEKSETYICMKNIEAKNYPMKHFYFDKYEDSYTKKGWEKLSKLEQRQLNNEEKYFKESTEYIFRVLDKNSSTRVVYQSEKSKYFHGQAEYVANLGYSEKGINSVDIILPKKGVYDFGEMKVITQPMDEFILDSEKLKENVLEDERIETNAVSGVISLQEDKILCLTVPYTRGWKAYVDGRQVEILKGNTMCMAIPLEEGEHFIELKYTTPGLKAGMILSTMGICVWVLIICGDIKKSRDNGRKKNN